MEYEIGKQYYAIWTRGWQCLATLIEIEDDGLYLMFNARHGYFYSSKEELDAHN